MNKAVVTQEYLKECFSYNKSTGSLTWKERPESHFRTIRGYRLFNTRFALQEAGSNDGAGYVRLSLLGKPYRVHRLIWLLEYGVWPKYEIDHVNHIRSDNRLCNLRSACSLKNAHNFSMKSNNTSGYNGVSKYTARKSKQWVAAIMVNWKQIKIGGFNTKEEAINARKQADIEYGFHANHGK